MAAARLALRKEEGLELEPALIAYLATIPTKGRLEAAEAVLAGILAIVLSVGMFLPRPASAEEAAPPVDHDQAFIGPRTEEEAGGEGNV